MLYPNGQRVLCYPGRHVAGYLASSGAMVYGGLQGARFNGTANFAKTASIPEGYAPYGSEVMPVKAGGMGGIGYIEASGSGNLLQGGPMTGNGDLTLTVPDASLSLVVSLDGTATISWTTTDGDLKLTLGMDGTGSFALTGDAGLSMIVPFDGTGSMSFTGDADLKGNLSMIGEWTPYTELSPENLARAVWEAVAAQYTATGTTGAKLNAASSGGVDLNALAQAVWEYAQREVTATPPGTATQTTALSTLAAAKLAAALSA